MATENENHSELGDAEDVPSDFFDDFTKDEFMDGLSVIDSWDNGEKKRSSRIDAVTIDSVKDLRELIVDDRRKDRRSDYYDSVKKKLSKDSYRKDPFTDYIKPGSRRDPNKTNEAIRKDKEVKVKEYLDKCLEGNEELRPPGTELDGYFAEKKLSEKKHVAEDRNQKVRFYVNTEFKRHSPRWSPKRVARRSPHHSPRRYSPQRKYRRYSPIMSQRNPQRRWSPHRRSPRWGSPKRHSPHRRSPQRRNSLRQSPSPRRRRSSSRHSPSRHSPSRHSPSRHSPKWTLRSRSPFYNSYGAQGSHTVTPPVKQDSFLYPGEIVPNYPPTDMQYAAASSYSSVMPPEYSGCTAPVYQQPTYYPEVYGGSGYDFGGQEASTPVPQPVPPPVLNPLPTPTLNQTPVPPLTPVPAPAMVPPPADISPPVQVTNVLTPYDALAQLVAEGKLSKEDYLKLAPHKGASHAVDNKAKVTVLHRCNQILSRLSNMTLPNRLVMNNKLVDIQEPKSLAPKYCSPLKRQATIDFHFTNVSETSSATQNKVLIDNILATIGLDNITPKLKKKTPKGMKDAAVQTTRPYCDICEIRESTTFKKIGTSIDLEYFSVTTHTQVVDEDLISSKSVFNPSGSVGDAAPISIAHLTPAQLVSQLAARAKTLKQTSETMQPQFRRNPAYDYDGRGSQQYQNNYNYRY